MVFSGASSRLRFTFILSSAFFLGACNRSDARAEENVPAPRLLPTRPNIVFILTDDQRWDQLELMPNLQRLMQANGITFTNGFVSSPLCTPSRATILSGRHPGHTGVWSNVAVHQGGWTTFHKTGTEKHTIATVLHGAGYYTGLFGKYFNGYGLEQGHRVPPGWDKWAAFTVNRYYGPVLSIQGDEVAYPADQYSTTISGQLAVDFIHSAPSGKPLFLYWAPKTVHRPYTPLESDKGSLASSLNPWRPPSYNESDVGDKPWYIQRIGEWNTGEQSKWDQVRQDQYEALIDVDRWLAKIVDALREEGRLSNTLLVFTSDNGSLLGEHRLTGKSTPYEESIRVPWVVRWDAANFPGRGGTDSHLMVNTDFATTFANVAGTSMGATDGLDFAKLAANPSTRWRTEFLITRGGAVSDTLEGLTYCGVRSQDFSYVQYWNGFEELYDMRTDQDQLANLVSTGYRDDSDRDAYEGHREMAQALCDPVPPGFTWSP